MSIKTNKNFWEEQILKDKIATQEYLKNGMILLKNIPPGKPLSMIVGGKFEKGNKIQNENTNFKKENLAEQKSIKPINNNSNNNQIDDSFNFGNILNSQKINELFGLNESENNNNENNQLNKFDEEKNIFNDKLREEKTNDNSYFNEEFNNLKNNYKDGNNFHYNNNCIKSKDNENNKNDKNNDDFFMDNDFQSLFNIFENERNNNIQVNRNNDNNLNKEQKNNNNININNSFNSLNNNEKNKKSNNNILDNFLNNSFDIENSLQSNNNEVLNKKNNINNNNDDNKYMNQNKKLSQSKKNNTSCDIKKNLEEFGKKFNWDEEVNMCNLKMFGYKKFRPIQREIINASLSDRDIFVCMPTGGGKSLTYQIPALIRNGVTLVVMPLISLIQDQTTYLQGCGVNVLFLNSENTINLN